MRFALLCLAALAGCVTPMPDQPPLSVVTVHEAPGRTKADVCRAARDWAAVNFRDSKAVIEVYDIEAGTLIGKGRVVVAGYAGTPFPINFTMRVECRDGRARSTFDDFTMNNVGGIRYPLQEDSLNLLRSKTAGRIGVLAADMGRAMAAGKSDF